MVTVSASVLFPFLLLNNTCFQDVMLSRFLSYGVSFEETPLVIIVRESLGILTPSYCTTMFYIYRVLLMVGRVWSYRCP